MLKTDTKGKILSDTRGREMALEDRWHPLVISFVKQVFQDGGRIEHPAIEEMNEAAWNGDFNDALFAFFASAYKTDKAYTLIGDDMIVERNSVAYRRNKYKLWQAIGVDIPLMFFDLEKYLGVKNNSQFTILNQRSEDLSNSYWLKHDVSIESTTIQSPIDGVFYQKVTKTGANPLSRWSRTTQYFENGKTYTLNAFFKDGTTGIVRLLDDSVPYFRVDFDLSNKTVVETSGVWFVETGIVEEKNGLRCWVTFTANQDIFITYACRFMPLASIGEYYYTTGVNLNEGTLQDYYKTTSSIGTRLADLIYQNAPVIGEGVLFVEVNIDNIIEGVTQRIFTLYQDNTRWIGIYKSASNDGIGGGYVDTTQIPAVVRTIVSEPITKGKYKVAFVFKRNYFATIANGEFIGELTTTTSMTVSPLTMYLGALSSSNPQNFNNNIKSSLILPASTTIDKLIEMTTYDN